jgi:hypothetical protein
MRLIELLQIVASYRFQMRLARTEATLAQANKILQDSKLAIQRSRQPDIQARRRSEALEEDSVTSLT